MTASQPVVNVAWLHVFGRRLIPFPPGMGLMSLDSSR